MYHMFIENVYCLCEVINGFNSVYLLVFLSAGLVNNKKGQLSLTNPRDACETFARFM